MLWACCPLTMSHTPRQAYRLLPLAAIALACASMFAPLAATAQAPAPTVAATRDTTIRNLGTPDFAQIARLYGPAVVNINASGTRLVSAGDKDSSHKGNNGEDDPEQEFLRKFQEQFGATGASMQIPVKSMGSGFIVSSDGIVLTNAHVIAHASEVTVKLTDRREYTARVLGSDPKTDVAVLKIDAKDLPTVRIGKPEELNVGEWVLAIGAPFGLDNTVTTGVVSAKGRSLPDDTMVPFIQTDAAINPGNSGGPLFNARGEVVGINSQIYTRSGGFQGLSFAIPIDLAQSVQRQIMATGTVAHGVLGVSVQEVTQALADAFHLERPYGALISNVRPDSAAFKAGLQSGDVIIGLDDHAIQTSSDLPLWVTMAAPGQPMQLKVLRNGSALSLHAVLDAAPKDDTAAKDGKSTAPVLSTIGLALRPLLPLEQRAANTTTGLLVDAVPDSSLSKGDIEAGDIILAINHVPLTSVEQARVLLAKAGPTVALLVQHGEDRDYIAIKLKSAR